MMNIVRYKRIGSDKIAANKEICRRVCKRAMAVLSIAIFIMFATIFPVCPLSLLQQVNMCMQHRRKQLNQK